MPRLPFAGREDLLAEISEIREERDRIVGNVSPARAEEQRACLAWWEHDLLEQLRALTEPEVAGAAAGSADTPPPPGSLSASNE